MLRRLLQTEKQHRQPLRPAEPRALSQLTLEDEDLLAEHQDLAVTIVAEEAGEQGSKRREQHEQQVPEHAGRMCALDGEVNTNVAGSTAAAGGPRRRHRSVLGPHRTTRGGDHAGPECLVSLRNTQDPVLVAPLRGRPGLVAS